MSWIATRSATGRHCESKLPTRSVPFPSIPPCRLHVRIVNGGVRLEIIHPLLSAAVLRVHASIARQMCASRRA
jgi:hypothetical protein